MPLEIKPPLKFLKPPSVNAHHAPPNVSALLWWPVNYISQRHSR